jgi:formamidopyrimidine-DNA glycosylase
MPELPEVETVIRELRPELVGRRLRSVAASAKKLRFAWQPAWELRLAGRLVEAIRRRGKWIMIDLDDGSLLLGHLGMTGKLRVVRADAPHEPHTHLVFALDNGHELRYRDVRRFGSLRYCPSPAEIASMMGETLGPEPWDLEPGAWYEGLRRSRRSLKAILLDQTVVAGIGNIYADEALFAAKISPKLTGAKITRPQAEQLRRAITRVLERAIAARGSTIRDYVGGSGRRGRYQRKLLAYGRAGQPCSNCGLLIQCIRLAGRATHYCPRCQGPKRRRGP